jgi:hypothetical protein
MAKNKVEEQDPLVRQADLARLRRRPATDQPPVADRGVRRRNCRVAIRGWPVFNSPMALEIRVVSRLSSGVGVGRIVGSRSGCKVLLPR